MRRRLSQDHVSYSSKGFVSLLTGSILLMLPAAPVRAQGPQQAKGVGPANHAIVGDTLSGSYFVAASLKEQYDRLLGRLDVLKRELDEQRVTGPEAETRLQDLRAELQKVRENIERTKVLVPIAKIHTIKDNTDFELGPERCLIITADQVKLVASEDSKVHCLLEKICLSADDQPADAELAAIKLVHRLGPAPDIVGKTSQQREAEEEEFRRSPDGRALTPAQPAG